MRLFNRPVQMSAGVRVHTGGTKIYDISKIEFCCQEMGRKFSVGGNFRIQVGTHPTVFIKKGPSISHCPFCGTKIAIVFEKEEWAEDED